MLSIIVPTYNEAENIHPLVERINKAIDGSMPYEIIIVDDDSPDGTAGAVKKMQAKHPVNLISRKERGLATAVLVGFKKAGGDWFVVMDADLQHPPEILPELMKSKSEAGIVVGSRYCRGGRINGWNWRRRLTSHIARLMAWLVVPKSRQSRDPLSGLFIVNKSVVKDLTLEPIGYKILLEILAKANAKVIDVPIEFVGRGVGESKASLGEYVNYLRHLWKLSPFSRFLTFCTVGASGMAVNLGAFWLLTRLLGILDLAALIMAWETSVIWNWNLNDRWTFRDRKAGKWYRRILKFNTISATSVGIYYIIYYPLTRFLSVYDLIALGIAILVSVVYRFWLNSKWTWAKK